MQVIRHNPDWGCCSGGGITPEASDGIINGFPMKTDMMPEAYKHTG
jgi:hypothetical protein